MVDMEYFKTGDVLGIEQRSLPADTYNIMRTLFHQCQKACLFVPIRSMQYQAIIDETEIAFVYAHRRSYIEFVWRQFQPQQRNSLSDPVPYEFIYYDKRALETMQRMQVEFNKFSHQFYDRQHQSSDSLSQTSVTKFPSIANKS